MKRLASMKGLAVLAVSLLIVSGSAFARDDAKFFSINSALSTDAAKMAPDKGIRFYFGDELPSYSNSKGDYVAVHKVNAFNTADKNACEEVFLDALLDLRDKALKAGGNAVIGIHSFYEERKYSSDSQYECRAGNVVARVTLRGTVVTLP